MSTMLGRSKAEEEQAMRIAKEAGNYAYNRASDITSMVREYIQRGPEGVGWLCFLGGMVTFLFGLLGLVDIFDALFDPLVYLINIYQMGFGVVTCVIEAPEEWVVENERLQRAQKFLHDFARFLTTFGGKGLFYLFQGSLAMSMTGVSLSWLLAAYMCFLGVLNIAMQYGYEPDLSFLSFLRGNGNAQADREYIAVG